AAARLRLELGPGGGVLCDAFASRPAVVAQEACFPPDSHFASAFCAHCAYLLAAAARAAWQSYSAVAVAWAALVLSSRARVTSVRLRVGSMDETSGGPQPSAPSCEVGTVPRRTGGCLREQGNSHTLTAMGRKWTACTDGQARRPPLGLGRLMARGVRSGAARLPRSLSPTGRSPDGPRRLPAPGFPRSVPQGVPTY